MKILIRIASCFVILALTAFPICVSALDLYSYEDDSGTKYVVDSLEKIPTKFRNFAKRDRIDSFKPKSNSSDFIKSGVVVLESSEAKNEQSSFQAPVLMEPLPDNGLDEDERYFASATIVFNALTKVQENNEKMYFFAQRNQLRHPMILVLQNESIKLLSDLKNLKLLEWKAAEEFMASYKSLLEQFWKVQWTVTKWIKDGGRGLKSGFLPLLQSSKAGLEKLDNYYLELKSKISAEKGEE